MLLQSHGGRIQLLPALPAAHWPDGSVTGLRARGDYTVAIDWKDGKLEQVTLHAGPNAPEAVTVVYAGTSKRIATPAGEPRRLRSGDFDLDGCVEPFIDVDER